MLKVICSPYHHVLFAFLYQGIRLKMESPTEIDQSRFSKMPVLSLFLKKKPQGAISELRFTFVSERILVHSFWRGNVSDSGKTINVQEKLISKAARKWLIPTFGLLWQQLDGYIFYGLKRNRKAGKHPAEERHMRSYIADTRKSD